MSSITEFQDDRSRLSNPTANAVRFSRTPNHIQIKAAKPPLTSNEDQRPSALKKLPSELSQECPLLPVTRTINYQAVDATLLTRLDGYYPLNDEYKQLIDRPPRCATDMAVRHGEEVADNFKYHTTAKLKPQMRIRINTKSKCNTV